MSMPRKFFHRALRWTFYRAVRLTGYSLRDANTGDLIAKVWILPWQGQLRVFGLPDFKPVRLTPALGPDGVLQSICLQAEVLPPPDFVSIEKNTSLRS